MLLESLRYFLAVVKTMSFSEAAEELNISQSALSKKIKSLELDLDVLLFYRTTRAIQLTEAGTALVPLANEVVLLENRVEAQMRRFRLRTKEVLRIASCPVFHLYGMAEMLANYRSSHPETVLQIMEGEMQHVVSTLERGEVDLAIIRTNFLPEGAGYEAFHLVDEELVVLCSADHPFAARKAVSISELGQENFALLKSGVLEYTSGLAKMGYDLRLDNMSVLCQNPGAIVDFVQKGLAISLMMRGMASLLVRDTDIQIVSLEEHPKFPLAIAIRRGRRSIASINFIRSATGFMEQNTHKIQAPDGT